MRTPVIDSVYCIDLNLLLLTDEVVKCYVILSGNGMFSFLKSNSEILYIMF